MHHHSDLENKSMKAVVVAISGLLLSACAITARPPEPVTSNYTAERLPDGSIRIIVTGTTTAPNRSRDARLELGDMLKDAASKECPSGYELSQDPVPVARTESGKLIATLGATVRCK